MKIQSTSLSFQRQIKDPRAKKIRRIKDFTYGTIFGVGITETIKCIRDAKRNKTNNKTK